MTEKNCLKISLTPDMTEKICVKIALTPNVKPSWHFFKKILKDANIATLDFGQSPNKKIPLVLTTGCCDDILEIKKAKDFPLVDKKCKCGEIYFVKWECL